MNSFTYFSPTKLVFGRDAVEQLNGLIDDKHKKILLHYGGGSIKRTGLYGRVIKILKDRKFEIFELSGVEPNPKLSLVRRGIELCIRNEISFILAVGGGSVIDSAKAIAIGALYDGDIWECFLDESKVKAALPVGVILTLPATGSEASASTVITNEEGMLKRSLDSDYIRPEFAILNPELTLTLPDKLTFAGITDIISHVLERYFTPTENVDLTDHLCEATLRSVMENAYKLIEDPNDYNARAEIMLSGTIAHCGILGLGRREDWASHRIGHEITALYGTTHGVTLSIVFPSWMKYVYKEKIDRFVRFAVKVFDVNAGGKKDEEIALEGIAKFEDFLKDIGMPVRLSEIGITTEHFELMAEKCTSGGSVGSFKELNKEDVINILELAL